MVLVFNANCEKKGSSIDKALIEIEANKLPALDIRMGEKRTLLYISFKIFDFVLVFMYQAEAHSLIHKSNRLPLHHCL